MPLGAARRKVLSNAGIGLCQRQLLSLGGATVHMAFAMYRKGNGGLAGERLGDGALDGRLGLGRGDGLSHLRTLS